MNTLLQNSFNINELNEGNTYKDFYYATLNDEDTQELEIVSEEPTKRRKSNDSLDLLFDMPTTKKRKILSSTVSRGQRGGGNLFLTTNGDEGARSTHLIKIEVFDMRKISKIPPNEHWKHSEYKIKYYTNDSNKNYQSTKKNIYNMAQEISAVKTCKKYNFNNI